MSVNDTDRCPDIECRVAVGEPHKPWCFISTLPPSSGGANVREMATTEPRELILRPREP